MSDPAIRRAHRAGERERARVRRRRAGIAPRFPGRRSENLPAEPLRAWLREAVARSSQAAVARAAGVSPDRIRVLLRGYYFHKLRTGESRRYPVRRVSLVLAERIVEGNGGNLDEVWPDGLV